MNNKKTIILILAIIFFITIGVCCNIYSSYYQSTNDAFIEGHLVSISPRISGQVKELLITDNEQVEKGDLLLIIDPADFEVKLAQSIAKLAEAKAALSLSEKEIAQSYAELKKSNHEISAASSKLEFAQNDYERYSAIYNDQLISKQQYETSKTSLNVEKSNHLASIEKYNASSSAVEASKAKKASVMAQIQKLEAEVKQDELNLSYTKIYAPQSGLVTSRNVEQGNYIQTAQPLFSIVPKKTWVIANFKETQLTNMKPNQPVQVKIDTYPGKIFYAKIDSIQRSTGAKTSLFPPENAVGSYVKIVQRIPVKIVFTEDYSGYNIVPGMSVVPKVKIR